MRSVFLIFLLLLSWRGKLSSLALLTPKQLSLLHSDIYGGRVTLESLNGRYPVAIKVQVTELLEVAQVAGLLQPNPLQPEHPQLKKQLGPLSSSYYFTLHTTWITQILRQVVFGQPHVARVSIIYLELSYVKSIIKYLIELTIIPFEFLQFRTALTYIFRLSPGLYVLPVIFLFSSYFQLLFWQHIQNIGNCPHFL